MKSFFKIITVVTIVCSFLYSCQKDEIDTPKETLPQVSKKVLKKIAKLGVNPNGVIPYTLIRVDGTKENGYLAHDIFFSKNDLATMEDLPLASDIAAQKLYRTRNLVNVPNSGFRVITIRGVNLDRSLENGLVAAVENFNRRRLKFWLRLSFGTSDNGSEIVVTQNNSFDAGAIAGFPRNGNPFNSIIIDGGASFIGRQLIEGLITHEIGHCFGFRHADFRTRSSCNRGIVDEETLPGAAEIGAIHIPGTSTDGDFQDSVMTSCYDPNAPKPNFTFEDVKALRALYQ